MLNSSGFAQFLDPKLKTFSRPFAKQKFLFPYSKFYQTGEGTKLFSWCPANIQVTLKKIKKKKKKTKKKKITYKALVVA